MKLQLVATILGAGLLAGCGSKAVSAEGARPAAAPPTGLARYLSSSHAVTIPQGTLVTIRTNSTLSTKTNRTGEVVVATLEAPLVVAGMVLAPRGSSATLLVADSDPGGRVKGVAKLGLRLTSLQVVGASQPLNTNIAWYQAHATKRKDAVKIGILSGVGAAIGALAGGGKGAAIGAGAGGGAGTALVLSTHGDAAVVPAESVVQFRLQQPLTVTVKG